MNEVYQVEIHDSDGNKSFPAFTCGHCSSIVQINPTRKERRTCMPCGRWICGREICNIQCTPLHSLADDHFESKGEWGKMVPAIMNGITSAEEGMKKGLIIP